MGVLFEHTPFLFFVIIYGGISLMEEMSQDDLKLLCSQQYNSPPPIHLIWVSWPILSLRQKVMVVGYLMSLIGLGLLLVSGGTLEYLMGLT